MPQDAEEIWGITFCPSPAVNSLFYSSLVMQAHIEIKWLICVRAAFTKCVNSCAYLSVASLKSLSHTICT